MAVRQGRVGWGFWLAWIVVAVLAVGAGILVMAMTGLAPIVVYAALAAVGAAVGIVQWRALQARMLRAGLWVIVSFVGLPLAGFVGRQVFLALSHAANVECCLASVAVVGATAAGLIVGGALTGLTLIGLTREPARGG